MKRQLIVNYRDVSAKEMFLYRLQNKAFHFMYIDPNENLIDFCRWCIDNSLLKFTRQKEYGGSAAEFQVLQDFMIQFVPDGLRDRLVFDLAEQDAFILTEILAPPAKKRGLMNLYDEWRIEVDVPTGDERTTFYTTVRDTLCK